MPHSVTGFRTALWTSSSSTHPVDNADQAPPAPCFQSSFFDNLWKHKLGMGLGLALTGCAVAVLLICPEIYLVAGLFLVGSLLILRSTVSSHPYIKQAMAQIDAELDSEKEYEDHHVSYIEGNPVTGPLPADFHVDLTDDFCLVIGQLN